MIIDMHSHDFADGIAVRAMTELCRKTEGVLWPTGDGTLANHLDHMDLAGVDYAVSCPIATRPSHFDVILQRAKAIRDGACGERAQRRIVPFASVHPLDPRVIEHLEAIAGAGLKGVKFHPYYQDFSLTDPLVVPMFRKIADLGLVVMCHAGADVSWRELHGRCGPGEIAHLLRTVPGLKFVAAHLGGCEGNPSHATDELIDLGCYVDTSALHNRWFRDEQMRVLRSWPRERILFATDFPWVHASEAIGWIKSVREPADWELLFGGNAARLLGL